MAVTPEKIPVPGAGKDLDTTEVVTGAGTVQREVVVLADPENPDAYAGVTDVGTGKGLNVHLIGLSPPAADMFSRLRVSSPVTIFDSQVQYDAQTDTGLNVWEHSLAGTGSASHVTNESCVRLSTGGTAGAASAVRQTHLYHRYQPGKSQLVVMTSVMSREGAGITNVRRRLGQFDANNGLFFELDGTTLYAVRRTYVSGAPVDTRIAQANWNIDKMDGTGASGVTIDVSKSNIFIICYQWLGVGAVVFGFDIDGEIVPCHMIKNANSLANVYMTTPNLPIRYEITNTGTAASTQTMDAICCSVIAEGGVETERGFPFSVNNGVTTVATSTTRKPILSLRPKTTFAGQTNRGQAVMQALSAYVDANSLMEIVYNGTLTGGSWTSANTNSICEYDVAASAITGGTVIDSQYLTGSNATRGSADASLAAKLALALDYAGTTGDIVSICVRTLSGTGTALASATWSEFR